MTNDFNEARESRTDTSKCPNCGANLIWQSEKQCLECEHCGTTVTVDLSKKSQEIDFEKIFNVDNSWSEETHVYRCNNCGAKEVISKKEIAKQCPFCGTTNIVKTDDLVGLKPNAVIPFKINKDKASENVILWAKKKFFAPKSFKESVYPEVINGNYSPAFTFDAKTLSSYFGRLGKYYYQTVRVNGKEVRKRKIKYFDIGGNFVMSFNDLLVQASDVISQNSINQLKPFDTDNSKCYQQEFLHGFTASQYTRSGQECFDDAKRHMDNRIKASILKQYDYDTVQQLRINTDYQDLTYKYILLPIYIGHCIFHNKNYNFFINGSNGKVTGKAPISAMKVSIVVILFIVVIALTFLLLYLYEGNDGGNDLWMLKILQY